MIILICISVYILTVLLWFLLIAYEYRKFCFTVGDVIEQMYYEHFFPVLNTFLLIAFIICIVFSTIGDFIWNNLKFNKIWEKFINIKLK